MGAPAAVEAGSATPDMVGFSTGGKGEQKRSFDRTYHNWGGLPITDAETFITTLNNNADMGNPRQRRVLRALTTPGVANELARDKEHALRGAVEYAAPVRTADGKRLYIVGAAYNGPERNGPGTQLESAADLPAGVVPYENNPKSLAEHVNRTHESGYRFVSTLDSEQVFDRVGTLLEETYGWSDAGLVAMRDRIHTETDPDFPQDQRSIFLTGTVHRDTGQLGSFTQAEALPFQLPDGQVFTLWESTEWVADEGIPVNGLVSGSAMLTSGQIAAAYGEHGNLTIVAETNRSTPAGAVARSAGMRTPQVAFEVVDQDGPLRIYVEPPQVLTHNVGINDGKPYEGPEMWQDGRAYPLRSFDLYQAPDALIRDLAQPQSVALTRRSITRV